MISNHIMSKNRRELIHYNQACFLFDYSPLLFYYNSN